MLCDFSREDYVFRRRTSALVKRWSQSLSPGDVCARPGGGALLPAPPLSLYNI